MAKRRQHSEADKRTIVQNIESGVESGKFKSRKQELKSLNIVDSVYYKWRKQFPPTKTDGEIFTIPLATPKNKLQKKLVKATQKPDLYETIAKLILAVAKAL